MEEPIVCTRGKVSRIFSPHQSTLFQSLYFALANDEKDEFMTLIKDPGFEQVRDSFTANQIFRNDALEIAIAVFNGKTKGLIDMEDKLKDGMTALHLAAINHAPRLTEYLLERGDKVDAVCDYKNFNLKHATPFDMIIQSIMYANEGKSLFEKLWRLCYHHRDSMEVIRMLVRSMQNTTWTRQAFLNYAHKGELRNLAALFLAVPELFLSFPESELSLLSKLDLKLNSLENKKDVEKQLSLMLDVFAMVGQKLAAYIRLEEFDVNTPKRFEQSHLELDFFLREVARKKPGVSTPDYYLSFFEADQQNSDDDDDLPDWDDWVSDLEEIDIFHILSDLLMRKDFVRTDIYRLIPSLEPQDADRLSIAIQEKLSSVSASHGCLETSAKTSKILKKRQKQQPPAFSNFSTRCFEPSVRSFHTSAGSANSMFDVKFTPKKSWESKVIQSTKLKSFSFVMLSHFPLAAKRLLK